MTRLAFVHGDERLVRAVLGEQARADGEVSRRPGQGGVPGDAHGILAGHRLDASTTQVIGVPSASIATRVVTSVTMPSACRRDHVLGRPGRGDPAAERAGDVDGVQDQRARQTVGGDP